MRKLHCCIFLKTRPRGEALRDDTRNHKHTHLVLLPIKTQRVMLPKQPRPKTPSTGAVTQRKHQLYKRTKSNPAHRPSISLGRMRASFPLVSTIEQCKHWAVRARKLSPSFCVTLAADFFPPPPLVSAHQPKAGSLVERIVFHLFPPFFLKNQHFCDSWIRRQFRYSSTTLFKINFSLEREFASFNSTWKKGY